MRAVESGDETVISLLLEKGAAPDSLSTYSKSPLSVAKDKGNKTVIKLLESYRKS
jgi:ankyrin repeat protein